MKERLKKIIREYWNIRVEILLTAAFVCVFFALNGGQIAQEVFAPVSGDRAEAVEAAGAGQGAGNAEGEDGGASKKDSAGAKAGTSASDNTDGEDDSMSKKDSADGEDGGASKKDSADAKDGTSASDNADDENGSATKKDSADAKAGTSASDNVDNENDNTEDEDGGASKKDSADAKDGTSASDNTDSENDNADSENGDAGSTESGSPDDAEGSSEITASGEIRVSDMRNGYELVVYRPAPFAQETQETETLRELVDTREMRGYRRLLSQEQMERLGIREQEVAERMGLTEQELAEYQAKEIYPAGRSFSVLEEMLSNRISGYDGDWSVYVKNLETEESLVLNDVPMKSASVMKLFIMGTVYKAFESGELERTEEVMSLMNSMITVSDNEASNRLLQLL